ncbi:MAG: type II secretion system F family protein [Limisphaera sp.]
MNLEQFAFLNRQLAGMLRAGLPLEASLRQVARDLQKGPWRAEWERLEADLSRGLPLARALEPRVFPELYKRLLVVGAQARDLAAVLNLLADYYLAQYQLWLRLKGLLVYPLLVLFGAFALSCLLHFHFVPLWLDLATEGLGSWRGNEDAAGEPSLRWIVVGSWGAFLLLALLCAGVSLVLGSRRLRERLAWHLPAFRESWVAQTASSLALLLKGGVPLAEALPLVERLFTDPIARADLARWRERLARGYARFAQVAEGSQRFPPLFIWMVAGAGEDLAAGFEQAAGFYEERARARAEQLLAVTLPVLVIVTGGIVLLQASALPMTLRALFVDVQVAP